MKSELKITSALLLLVASAPLWADVKKPEVTEPKKRSMEWQQLPRQKWELSVPVQVDINPLKSLTQNTRLGKNIPLGKDPQLIVSSKELSSLGQIVGSRTEGEMITLGDLVFIEADSKLQVNTTYTLTSKPTSLKSPRTNRTGYGYQVAGKVTLVGMRDELFIGKVIEATDLIKRGSFLLAVPPRIPELDPIPSPKAMEALLLIDPNSSTYATAAHKEVYIDRGSDDGVKPGMVFRAYEYMDPSNKKRITDANISIIADILVTQVSTTYATGLIIHSRTIVSDKSKIVLLTDVSDLRKFPEFKAKKDPTESDDLDKLDDGRKLAEDEKKKLKQLEKWKANQNADALAPLAGEPTPIPPPATPEVAPSASPPTSLVAPPEDAIPLAPPAAEPTPPAPTAPAAAAEMKPISPTAPEVSAEVTPAPPSDETPTTAVPAIPEPDSIPN